MGKWVSLTSAAGLEIKLKLKRTPRLELIAGHATPLGDRIKAVEPIESLEDLARYGFEVPDVYADLIDILDEMENEETWH